MASPFFACTIILFKRHRHSESVSFDKGSKMDQNIDREDKQPHEIQVPRAVHCMDEVDMKPEPTFTTAVKKIEQVTSLWSPATIILFWIGMDIDDWEHESQKVGWGEELGLSCW